MGLEAALVQETSGLPVGYGHIVVFGGRRTPTWVLEADELLQVGRVLKAGSPIRSGSRGRRLLCPWRRHACSFPCGSVPLPTGRLPWRPVEERLLERPLYLVRLQDDRGHDTGLVARLGHAQDDAQLGVGALGVYDRRLPLPPVDQTRTPAPGVRDVGQSHHGRVFGEPSRRTGLRIVSDSNHVAGVDWLKVRILSRQPG